MGGMHAPAERTEIIVTPTYDNIRGTAGNLTTCARRWYRFNTKGDRVPGGAESAGATREWADR